MERDLLDKLLEEVEKRLGDRLKKFKENKNPSSDEKKEFQDTIEDTIKEVATEIAGEDIAKQIFNEQTFLNFLHGISDYGVYQSSKKDMILGMLEEGLVMLFIDSRDETVICPDKLKGDHSLRINVSWKFGIKDLEIDDKSVRGSFSFNSVEYYCEFPMPTIWGLTHPGQDDLLLFYRDVPEQVLEEINLNKEAIENAKKEAEAREKKKSIFSVVKNE